MHAGSVYKKTILSRELNLKHNIFSEMFKKNKGSYKGFHLSIVKYLSSNYYSGQSIYMSKSYVATAVTTQSKIHNMYNQCQAHTKMLVSKLYPVFGWTSD